MTAAAGAGLSRSDWLKAGAVVVIWGLNFVVMKVGMPGLGPMLLGALRFAAASLPVVFFLRRPAVPWRFLVAYGLAQGLGQFGLLFTGLALGMPAGMASVVMQAQAFFTLLLAVPLLGERVRRHQALGLLVSAAGLGLIGLAAGAAGAPMRFMGFALTLGAALMWAVSNLVVRFMGRGTPQYDPVAFIAWSSLVPIAPFMALAVATQGAEASWQALAGLGWRQVAAVLFLGLLATLLAYGLWTDLLRRHPVGRVAPFSLLVPVVGLLAAYAAFGERLSPLQWAGTLAVLGGLALNQLGGLRRR